MSRGTGPAPVFGSRFANRPVEAGALPASLAGARVFERGGDDAVAYAGRLLAAAGATVVLLELDGVESAGDDGRRAFLHAGKLSVAFAAGSVAEECAALLADRAAAVLGSDEASPAAPSEPWETALRGTSLALSSAARILGMSDDGLTDLDAALSAGTLFPIPGSPGAHSTEVVGHASPRLLRARDGWVVTGPSSLGDETLTRLVWADGSASVEEWVRARDRIDACTTLQQWRTGYAPAYDLAEAATLDADEPAPARAPRRGEHTTFVLRSWLGLSDDAVASLVDAGAVAA